MSEVYLYLKRELAFRERKNKNKGIANLISEKYNLNIPRDKRDDIIADVLNMDRQWRKHLEDYPELRGKDYDQKTILEQKKKMELGYEPGFNQKLKI